MVKQVTTRTVPIPGVVAQHHQVLLNGQVIHSQISALDLTDVASAVARHQQSQRQLSTAAAATYRCSACSKEKPANEYPFLGAKRRGICKTCHKDRRRAREARA